MSNIEDHIDKSRGMNLIYPIGHYVPYRICTSFNIFMIFAVAC